MIFLHQVASLVSLILVLHYEIVLDPHGAAYLNLGQLVSLYRLQDYFLNLLLPNQYLQRHFHCLQLLLVLLFRYDLSMQLNPGIYNIPPYLP